MNTSEKTEKECLKEMLEEVLKSARPTIYKSLRHCSRSWYVEKVTERKIDRKNGGVKIGGCGMDMGFALIDDMFTSMRAIMGEEFSHGKWQSKFSHTWI